MLDTSTYFNNVLPEHRKRLGQFFTPKEIADFMVEWVMQSGYKELYDPAYGLGAFNPKNKDINFSASEVDSNILKYADLTHDNNCLSIYLEDYLATWGRKHANIVCNPPYARFQNFADRNAVFDAFQEKINVQLSGYTNTASAFLIKSLTELKSKGRLAYIMPLEFLNTGYGIIIKKILLKERHLMAIINLECEKEVFPDATTTAGIILYDSAKQYDEVSFYNIKNIHDLTDFESLQPTTKIYTRNLDPRKKWLPFFQAQKIIFNEDLMVPLVHYGRFSRGIATGANEFFVLTPSKAQLMGLSQNECKYCISRSSQINQPVFLKKDLDLLIQKDAPIILFSANDSISKNAEKYISSGEIAGYHKRFLTRNRSPWYKTETRQPALLLLGVFSRGGYKIILNRTDVLNLTCYHGFRPDLFGCKYLEHLFLYFFSQTGRNIVSLSKRKYGDSLDKFEPNDLNLAMVPSQNFFDTMENRLINLAIREVESKRKLPEELELFFSRLQS